MKKCRTKQAPRSGLEIPLPVKGVGITVSTEHAKELVLAGKIKAVEYDERNRRVKIDVEHEIRPRSGPIDPTFNPWLAGRSQVEAYGPQSQEMGAWIVAQTILANRASVESDSRLLLELVADVLAWGLESPDWLAAAFSKRLGRLQTFQTATLDDAFGLEPPTDRKLDEKRNDLKRGPIHAAVLDMLRANPRRAIDNDLHEEVGRQFGVGKTKCQELVKKAVDEDGEQDPRAFKKLLKIAAKIPSK